MTAKECIKGRRSIRSFTEQPVDHALLSEIIETASYAPSWKHTQITRYIAVEGELKNKLASECTSAYPRNGEIIAQAPMLIVVTYIKNRSGFERDGSYSTAQEGSWQMYEKGLGSVIMGIFDEAEAASLLNIPEEREIVALIPIGYPAEEPVAPRRKPVEDLLSFME